MTNFKRPDWVEYFLALAFVIASRSRDPDTKHGAVITDKNNIILGTGYNSPVKGLPDKKIPITRPQKYPYMIHAEENALLNCKVMPRESLGGGTVYITGFPCHICFQRLVQAEVNEFFIANRSGTRLATRESNEIIEFVTKHRKIKLHAPVNIKLNWLLDFIKSLELN